jgi:hypothetical protein
MVNRERGKHQNVMKNIHIEFTYKNKSTDSCNNKAQKSEALGGSSKERERERVVLTNTGYISGVEC